jgi:hypothetical protein
MPPPLNSFEAALAKKGITLKTALEKPQYWWFNVFIDRCPPTCEVTSPAIQDVLMEGDYAKLPNLTLVFPPI